MPAIYLSESFRKRFGNEIGSVYRITGDFYGHVLHLDEALGWYLRVLRLKGASPTCDDLTDVVIPCVLCDSEQAIRTGSWRHITHCDVETFVEPESLDYDPFYGETRSNWFLVKNGVRREKFGEVVPDDYKQLEIGSVIWTSADLENRLLTGVNPYSYEAIIGQEIELIAKQRATN